MCDEIPLTPEEFIVCTVSEEIHLLINNIENGNYAFLTKYKDFSKFIRSVENIYENCPNRPKIKERK